MANAVFGVYIVIHNLPDTLLRIGNDTVVPVRSVRNLGIYSVR